MRSEIRGDACVASCVSKGSARSSGAIVSVSAGAVKPLVEQLERSEPVRRRLEPAESVGRLALASCVCKGVGVSCDGCCAALARRDGVCVVDCANGKESVA